MTADTEGKRTPLYAVHCQLGARLIQFGGWEMPVSYRGIIEEHQAVRTHAGLFDVSHMGEIEISGPGAEAALQYLTLNDVRPLQAYQLQYSALCNEAGGLLDDLTVCRLAADRFLLIVNAANIAKDFHWITQHLGPGARADDRSDAQALLACRGQRRKPFYSGSAPRLSGCYRTIMRWRPRWMAMQRWYHAPAILVKMVLKCSSRRHTLSSCGRRSWRLVRPMACCPWAWGHAIRCVWKHGTCSTVKIWTRPPTRSRLAWGGLRNWTRESLLVETP